MDQANKFSVIWLTDTELTYDIEARKNIRLLFVFCAYLLSQLMILENICILTFLPKRSELHSIVRLVGEIKRKSVH